MKHLNNFQNFNSYPIVESYGKYVPVEYWMKFDEYLSLTDELSKLIDSNEKIISRYFELNALLDKWHKFFYPHIYISEVNNKGQGHIYLAKIRVPSKFADARLNNPSTTFRVCNYRDLPGEENKEKRQEIAYQKGTEKLKQIYPELYRNSPTNVDYKDLEQKIEKINKLSKKYLWNQ